MRIVNGLDDVFSSLMGPAPSISCRSSFSLSPILILMSYSIRREPDNLIARLGPVISMREPCSTMMGSSLLILTT
uniref:Uncharacterized protein n=1 Tax=Arundo donax TaxID=35708 RepID=A0A0A9D6X6_ARUDO